MFFDFPIKIYFVNAKCKIKILSIFFIKNVLSENKQQISNFNRLGLITQIH